MNKNEEERTNDTYELELEGEMKNGIREKTVMKCVSHGLTVMKWFLFL